MRRLCLLVPWVSVSLAVPAGAQARADSVPPPAFSRVEAARFGAVFVLGGLAYFADQAVRDAVRGDAPQDNGLLGGVANVGNRFGQPGVMGLGVVLWGGGLLAGEPTVAATGLRALEAIVVSGVITQAIKEIAGRARPAIAPSAPDDWQLFRGARTDGGDYESFASGHATAAFAFAAAVTDEVSRRAPEHARWVGLTTYGLAVTTAYARMHDDRHWLSDVTVGAGVGTVTAWAITRWHATRPDNAIDRILLRPVISASPQETRVGVSVRWR